jgi:hypothetical protein
MKEGQRGMALTLWRCTDCGATNTYGAFARMQGCPKRPYAHLTTREQFIAEAAKHELDLELEDFTGTGDGDWYLDGMPAAQWLDAMTME